MWHSSRGGPSFGMTLQNRPVWTWEGLADWGSAAPLCFLGQAGTEAQRPFVPTLFRCCGLVIVYFLFSPNVVFSAAASVSFIPLFLLSPCHSIFCLTYCLTAGMLSAVSLSQLLAVTFISLKREKPFSFRLVLHNSSPTVSGFISF